MELFSEIYSTYYNAVRRILCVCSGKLLSVKDLQRILKKDSFSESAFEMLPKLQNGDWPLLQKDGEGYASALSPLPEIPLTGLQLAWMKAVLDDPRMKLFFCKEERDAIRGFLGNRLALFSQDDFYTFDKAKDGDDYEDEQYQNRFRTFLFAVRNRSAVSIRYEGGKGDRMAGVFWPYKLEYSARDDKFRALCYRRRGSRKVRYVLNLGRVVSVLPETFHQESAIRPDEDPVIKSRFREAILEISKERNALERCMIQFAHYEKRTEYDPQTDRYNCTIQYNVMDETELAIRILSFGPTVKVLGPEQILLEIRNRVRKQVEWDELRIKS